MLTTQTAVTGIKEEGPRCPHTRYKQTQNIMSRSSSAKLLCVPDHNFSLVRKLSEDLLTITFHLSL